MIRKFSVATALAMVMSFQGAVAMEGKGCSNYGGMAPSCKSYGEASSHDSGGAYARKNPTHGMGDSVKQRRVDDSKAKSFKISLEGEVEMNGAKLGNKDYYKIARGQNGAMDLYVVASAGPLVAPADGVAYTAQEVVDHVVSGRAVFKQMVSNPRAAQAALPALFTGVTLQNPEYKRVLVRSDAGVLGNYSNESRVRSNIGADMAIVIEDHYVDDIYYGGRVHLKTESPLSDSGGIKSVRGSGVSLFIRSMGAGMVEYGGNVGAAEAMRLDASSVSTQDGGIDGNWFRYANVEGRHENGIVGANPLTESLRSMHVRHPFHVLPRLYSSYRRVPNAPWLAQGRETENDEAVKFTYYSANYAGFQVGLSYTCSESANVAPFSVDESRLNRSDYEGVVSGGISYEKDFGGGFGVKVALTGETAKHEDSDKYHDMKGWNIGGMLDYSGVRVAASYANAGKSGLPKMGYIDYNRAIARPAKVALTPGDTTYWTLGASYSIGPAMVSATYFESMTKPYTDSSEYENKLSVLAIGAQYDPSFGTSKKGKWIPYVSWVKFTPKEKYYADDLNNSGSVVLGGVSFSF